MSRALNGLDELALMLGTCPGDSFGDDLSLLGNEALQSLLVLVVDVYFLGVAEPAGPFLPRHLVLFVASGSSLVTSWIVHPVLLLSPALHCPAAECSMNGYSFFAASSFSLNSGSRAGTGIGASIGSAAAAAAFAANAFESSEMVR